MERYFKLIVVCLVFLTVTTGMAYADSMLPTDNQKDLPIAIDPTIGQDTDLDIDMVEDMLDEIMGQKTGIGSTTTNNGTAATVNGVSNVQSTWTTSGSSYDIFMKIDGIQGASMDAKHRNEIDLISYSFNIAGSNKKSCEIIVRKYIDNASPDLMFCAASGRMTREAVITARKTGSSTAELGYSIELKGIKVTSYEQHPYSNDNEAVIEEVSFEIERVIFNYKPIKPDGTPADVESIGWDFKTGKEL